MKLTYQKNPSIINKWNKLINQIPFEYIMGSSLAAVVFHLLLVYSPLSILFLTVWILLSGSVMVMSSDSPFKSRKFKDFIRKYGIASLIWLTLFLCFWLELSITPGLALWYRSPEEWMKTSFNKSNEAELNTAIEVVFNSLRAFFLLYVAVSLVKVVNAVREEEDWQQISRKPLLIVAVIVVGDVIAELIIGT